MSVNGQVLINMKTKITSYGPHNGIIVHYGVQQEPNMFWPCTLNGAPNSLSSQRFDAAPTFATIHWPTIEDSGDDRRNKGTPCMSNRYYHLTDENGTSSNVFEKVRLNVFETKPMIAEINSFNVAPASNNSYKSDSDSMAFKISNGDISSTKKSLTTAQINDYHHNAEKAMKKRASNQNIRLEPVIHSGRDEQHASITRIDSNLTPVKQPFKRTAASCEQYSDLSDGIAKYDYNQIEKEFARDSFLTAIPVVTTDPKMVDESMNGFTVHWQKTTDCRFSEHLAGSSAYPLNQQWQQYRSTPDLCQMQLNHREVPEQLYHLYETQDAFGNLLAQFEMEIEICEQLPSQLSSSNVSKKHLNINYGENNGNLMENFGLPLIPENFSPGSRLKDDNHTRPLPAYLQHYSLPSTNTFNDADILRHACGSLYVRPVIPISLEKVLESAACTKSDKIEISAGGIKNVPEKTASEYSKDPARLSPIKNSKQLELTAGKRSHREEMMEKKENLENISEELRSHNTDTDSIQSAGSSPIRSILHMSSQKSNVRKKVQFPAEWPRVIALEHRLLIDDLSSV